MFRNVQGCLVMLRNAYECLGMFRNAQECLGMVRNVQECLSILRNVQGCLGHTGITCLPRAQIQMALNEACGGGGNGPAPGTGPSRLCFSACPWAMRRARRRRHLPYSAAIFRIAGIVHSTLFVMENKTSLCVLDVSLRVGEVFGV